MFDVNGRSEPFQASPSVMRCDCADCPDHPSLCESEDELIRMGAFTLEGAGGNLFRVYTPRTRAYSNTKDMSYIFVESSHEEKQLWLNKFPPSPRRVSAFAKGPAPSDSEAHPAINDATSSDSECDEQL